MSDAMDNFEVKVVAQSSHALKTAIEMTCTRYKHSNAWIEVGGELIFYWAGSANGKNGGQQEFPIPMSPALLLPLISNWLSKREPLGKYPDIDGSCSKGFELKTPVGILTYEMFRVRPIWAIHHK